MHELARTHGEPSAGQQIAVAPTSELRRDAHVKHACAHTVSSLRGLLSVGCFSRSMGVVIARVLRAVPREIGCMSALSVSITRFRFARHGDEVVVRKCDTDVSSSAIDESATIPIGGADKRAHAQSTGVDR